MECDTELRMRSRVLASFNPLENHLTENPPVALLCVRADVPVNPRPDAGTLEGGSDIGGDRFERFGATSSRTSRIASISGAYLGVVDGEPCAGIFSAVTCSTKRVPPPREQSVSIAESNFSSVHIPTESAIVKGRAISGPDPCGGAYLIREDTRSCTRATGRCHARTVSVRPKRAHPP